jgi:hypothetical protein
VRASATMRNRWGRYVRSVREADTDAVTWPPPSSWSVRRVVPLSVPSRTRVIVMAAAGLVGSVTIALTSWSVGATEESGPQVISRAARFGLQVTNTKRAGIAYPLFWVGLAVLAGAWMVLGHEIFRAPGKVSARRVRGIALTWAAPLLFAAPVGSRDLWAYAAQANVAAHGVNPYLHGPSAAPGTFTAQVSALWAGSPSPYGPGWVGLTELARILVGAHPLLVVFAARLLNASGVVILAAAIPRLAKRAHNDAGRALWACVANPLILVDGVAGGHNDLLMAALVSVGLVVASGSWKLLPAMALAGAVVGVATCVKLPALIAVLFLPTIWARRRGLPLRWRVQLSALAVAGATCFGSSVLITTSTGYGFGWISVAAAHHHSGGAVGIVLVALAGAIAWERSRVWEPVAMLSAAIIAALMVTPIAAWWYWIFPIAIAAPLLRRRPTAVVLAGISLALLVKVRPDGNALYFRNEAILAATLFAAWLFIDRTRPSSWKRNPSLAAVHDHATMFSTAAATFRRERAPADWIGADPGVDGEGPTGS